MNRVKTKLSILSIMVSAAILSGCNHNDSNTSNVATYRAQAEELVAKMSADEKLSLLVAPGMPRMSPEVVNARNPVPGIAGWINGVYNEETGLDLVAVKLADGPAGLRVPGIREDETGTFYATAFPIGSLLASTWNPQLVAEVGKAAGNEAKEYGLDMWLAPAMNIQRNPLLGRSFEYYSEDPLLSGMMGAAIVNGAQSEGVGTTVKHFAANNSENNRFLVDAVVTPRALREIYLRGFKYVVKNSKPWGFMSAYNSINGTHAGHRADLMTDILRGEWGYDGLVMSDWFAGYATDDPVAFVKAGVDVIEPGGTYIYPSDWAEQVEDAYYNNELSDAIVDRNAVNIITQTLKTPSQQNYQFSNNPDLNTHAKVAKQVAEEGVILLKNNDALPIATSQSIASFGVGQINTLKGGTGSGDVYSAYLVNVLDGLSAQYEVDADLSAFYELYNAENSEVGSDPYGVSEIVTIPEAVPGSSVNIDGSNVALADLITASALTRDAAIITIGRQAGEAADRELEGDYQFTAEEIAMIQAVSEAFHAQDKKVVMVLNVNGVVDVTPWQDMVDGIILPYMAGQETGNVIADIISGEANPSGKLTQTFPNSYSDVPSSATYAGVDTDGDASTPELQYYNEDIYVGYRYYSTFNEDVAYPFGYGLSYTTFNMDGTAVTSNTLNSNGRNGSVTITTTVSNTGSVAGKEVAQVYINTPEVKLKKPEIELKAFAKTDSLAAGEAQQLTFEIPAGTLASFDSANNQWIVEPGVYTAYVGSSSDISSATRVTFTVSSEIVVEETTEGALALEEGVSSDDFVDVTED